MKDTVIQIDNLSKQYRLGIVGTGSIVDDINRWWAKVQGKEDPFLKIGDSNIRTVMGNSDYVWALRNINMNIAKGEVVGIIGKNGAGKSTLLKILSKVTGPTTGILKSKGRIASLLEVGTGFHPELTGEENVFLNGAILGMSKAEIKDKLKEIIDFSGIIKYKDTPVKRYSSGMRVRLGFSVAAFLEPEILIVDEVLAVGDAEFQEKAIGKMKDVSSGGKRTVLFVSHNMQAVQNLCDRVFILKDGEISSVGPTRELIQEYLGEKQNLLRNDSASFFNDIKRIKGAQPLASFKEIEFYNDIGEKNTYLAKEQSQVVFKFKVKISSEIKVLKFLMAIKSPTHDEIITSTPRYDIDLAKAKNNIIEFELRLDDINLRPNKYNLYFYLGDGKKKGYYEVINNETPPLVIEKGDELMDSYDSYRIMGFFNQGSSLLYT